ncbi:MAG: LPP20 family lipoprotein [Sphingobacteriaceae bacterium]|nr:LPP20 family lipoprotein [Sphingobacteriaceae bacterium]
MKKTIYILTALILFACKSKKELESGPVVAESKPAPLWVSSRPNSGFKFVGIGFADKAKTSSYAIEAKKNALYDLSSEIKVDISSNSVIYTVQNNKSFNENYNSLIKMSNSENIEGYQQVDTYENDKQYWVYYTLDKAEYAKQKEQKKQQIITKASNLIASAYADEQSQDFSSSLKKRIQAFGVLTPYLNEEINFDASITKGLKNVFDLTNLIQQQLQSITIANINAKSILKPYQKTYEPLVYQLQVKGKSPLQNFPFVVESEEDKIKVIEKTSSNNSGEVQVKVSHVDPLNQMVAFNLNPDISGLMGADSVGKAGINVLKQFIQTSALKVQAKVSPVNLFVNCNEKNFGKPTGSTIISTFIQSRFSGQEITYADKPENADYIIDVNADTREDVSSHVLDVNYGLKMAALVIDLNLKRSVSGEVIYHAQINDIYGYANSGEKAGINTYSSNKLNFKLGEALFFLKGKMLVY